MDLNYIYKFDADILYDSMIEDGILKCSAVTCDLARRKVSKRDSLLFEQINILKPKETGLEEILVILDFSEFIKKHSMDELRDVKEIQVRIHKIINGLEEDGEEVINVVDFLKSNSMSKDCQVYYINSRISSANGSNLYYELKKRVFFDFDKQTTILSKLYAYSGTLCSDCTLLDIVFNEDEVVVVDDKQFIEKSDCITMISMEFLYNELNRIPSYIVENPDKNISEILEFNACLELKSLYESMNDEANNISDDLKAFLSRYNDIPKSSIYEFDLAVKELISAYSFIGSRCNDVDWEKIYVKNYPFDLNLFDGEGFISKEFCNELQNKLCIKLGNDKYKNSTSFQIRMPYVKGMVHSCDMKLFFKNKKLTEIQHVIFNNGKRYDVNKIKLLLTKSQFKLEGFIKNNKSDLIKTTADYINLINLYSYSFGVIDANKEEKNHCSLEYQFISTLPLEYNNIVNIYHDNKWIINNLCSRKNVLSSLMNEDSYWSKKEIEIFNLNKDFYFLTQKYKNRRVNIYSRLKHKALFSKFDVHGSRRYLSSDLLELLYFIAYFNFDKFEKNNWLHKYHYYMPSKNPRNNKAVFLRSPHYSRNEIVLLNRRPIELFQEREEYFSHLTGVVMINPRSLAADRLGGADYDGDSVLVVNDKNIVSSVTKEMVKIEKIGSKWILSYKYLPCKIPSLKGKNMEYNKYNDRLQCFQNTFSSNVGRLSNEALFKALEAYGKNASIDESSMSEYTILNGLEIDSAKNGKKPKMDFSKNAKDEALSIFLDAKKEFDEFGTLKGMKFLLKHYYDGEAYYNEQYPLDIDEIKELNYGYNIVAIAHTMNNITLFKETETNSFYVNDCTKPNDITKALAIESIYSNVNKLIRRTISNKAKMVKNSQVNRIYDQLLEITNKNNIDLDELLSNISMNNLEAFKNLEKYVGDGYFHYLKNDAEKTRYLKEIFIDLEDSLINSLLNFNNEGYRLLFLLLNYFLTKITKIELNSSIKEKENIENKIQYLNKKSKKQFYELYSKYESDINTILEKSMNKNEDEVKNLVIDYLKKQAETLCFADVYSTINIYSSNMIFDVYFDVFKNYLGGKDEKKD